jgi:hypothetical protein
MSGKRWATAAALCVFVVPSAIAQKAAPVEAGPAATGPQLPAAGKTGQLPRALPDKLGADAKLPAVPWSQQDVEAAQARCTALLKGIDAVVVPEAPMREGAECGTPAPMKLISVGKGPQVAFSPPPTVTCDMVATLAKWFAHDVQPLARKHLGAPIVRVETMSSYSCRNAYGRAHGRVSEHGRANAVDIGSFVTARGQAALVIADWGPTARQIAAQAAAGNAADEAQTKKAPLQLVQPGPLAPAGVQSQQRKSAAAQRPTPAASAATIIPLDLRPGMVVGIPGITLDVPGSSPDRTPAFGLAPPSRLGGPKPPPEAAPPINPDGKTDFLRAVHRSACNLFNTVLGPEANYAHHNHFHLDMAERIKHTKICE